MKKYFSIFALASMAVLLTLAACKKEENNSNEGGDSALEAFCGTYDLTIVTDSVQNNGTWFSNSALPEVSRIPDRSGRLTITKADDNSVNILGRICIAGDSVDYYRTTGTLDADGRLSIAPGQDYQNSTRVQHFTFSPMPAGNTAVFKVDASYKFNGVQLVERSTNTAVKRQ